jgi:hypothetical protein
VWHTQITSAAAAARAILIRNQFKGPKGVVFHCFFRIFTFTLLHGCFVAAVYTKQGCYYIKAPFGGGRARRTSAENGFFARRFRPTACQQWRPVDSLIFRDAQIKTHKTPAPDSTENNVIKSKF